MSQKAIVLDHMRKRGSITTLIAFKRYAITRLAPRVVELEHDGHLINHTWINRGGKRYMAYSLVG